MKRIIALSLTLVMLLTMLPLVGVAESRDSVCRCTSPVVGEWFYSGTNDCTVSAATRVGVCKICGKYFTDEIPVQPFHNLVELPMYDEEGKLIVNSIDGKVNYCAPTCEKQGYIKKKCSTCHMIVEETLEATGHKYGDEVIYIRCFVDDDPNDVDGVVNNLTLGITRKYCINEGCNAYEEERSSGHSIHYVDGTPASCFGEGTTGYKYCVTCGTESTSEPIDKLEHKDEDGNGKCDLCMSQFREVDGVYCSCMCHSENSFIKLLMPLLKLIWQLLGVDNCHGDCNAVHYVKE